MLTEIGKFTRKLRIDNDELLNDMARKLCISPAFLSKVENGVTLPTPKIEVGLIESYHLAPSEVVQLQETIRKAREPKVVSLEYLPEDKRELVIQFAHSVNELTQADYDAIQSLLDKNKPVKQEE